MYLTSTPSKEHSQKDLVQKFPTAVTSRITFYLTCQLLPNKPAPPGQTVTATWCHIPLLENHHPSSTGQKGKLQITNTGWGEEEINRKHQKHTALTAASSDVQHDAKLVRQHEGNFLQAQSLLCSASPALLHGLLHRSNS